MYSALCLQSWRKNAAEGTTHINTPIILGMKLLCAIHNTDIRNDKPPNEKLKNVTNVSPY